MSTFKKYLNIINETNGEEIIENFINSKVFIELLRKKNK